MIIINHDNKSEILKDIRTATSIEEVHTKATELGLIASHTFDMSWISLAETPTGEDIFVARKTDKVHYKDYNYPTRTFVVESPEIGGRRTYTIATESLSEALGDKKEVWDTKENDIDSEIYFYVEDEVIGLDAEEICEKYLDVPMKFIEEDFEFYQD
jgi:hypothetical protein